MIGRSGLSEVSFLIPARNQERFVVESLASAIGQTCPPAEVVVVDDGSTDGTGEVLARMARSDPRLRIVRGKGTGIVDALNRGLEAISTPYVARLDSDDIAEPGRIQHQLAYLDAHSSVAVVGSHVRLIDDRGHVFGCETPPTDPADVAERLLVGNVISHTSVLFRAEAVRAAGGYRDGFPFAEDYDLWLRLAERHQLANIGAPLTRYRIHEGQVGDQRLFAQAAGALAARAVSRLRRAEGHEPPLPEAPDEGFLASVGVTRADLARAVATSALERASLVERIDLPAAVRIVDDGRARVAELIRRSDARLDRRAVRYALASGSRRKAIMLSLRRPTILYPRS